MGFELEGIIGERATFRTARGRFSRMTECRLSGDLVLVPLTGPLLVEAARHFGIGNAASVPTQVTESLAALVSESGPAVHVSAFEFGDDGHERYTLWVDGTAKWTRGRESQVRQFFTDERGVDAGPGFDIGKHRGESAAERWAAADAIPESPEHH